MRDYRNAKVMAQTLRDDLSEKSFALSHSESLELVARMLGLRDWNVLAAKIEDEHGARPAEAGAVEGNAATSRSCAFCGKTEHQVAKLIAGPTAFICGGCVELCTDVLIDNDPGLAHLTRESLQSKSAEELILLKARIGRNLLRTQRNRDAIARHTQSAPSTTGAKPSLPVAYYLRKSPEERRAHLSEIESRIDSMERGLAMADELLGRDSTARKSNDS
jgi:hypothetical protein